jgi:hypothetical protein
MFRFTIFCCFSLFSIFSSSAQDTWRGLIVEPENRCSPYDKSEQYPYPQSVEDTIVAQMGGHVYGPYTGRYFTSDSETDIEHIVAASEGHDSGLCSASEDTRAQFATDILNLTLAAPEINRCGSQGKCGLDAAEWMPAENKCWFANQIIEIKTKYALSVNQAEVDALDTVLTACESFEMIFFPKADNDVVDSSTPSPVSALKLYDDNNNGRITCAEARAHGITPVRRGHAAYDFMNDRDNDGVVCE